MMNERAMVESCGQDMIRPSSVTEKLEARKKQLEDDLERVNSALEKLQANPEIAEAVDAISKVGYL